MRWIAALAAFASLAACDTPNFRTAQFQFGDAQTLAATGNLRLVTERDRRLPENTARVMCSEPSPDYAVASGTIANSTFQAASPSPISQLSGALTTSETVSTGTGRDKGVLALRDGLYAACQAYVNGLIGKDAYSIVLSQYGLLLVSLLQQPANINIPADAKKLPNINLPKPNTGSPFAVMLVACINQYDPTRRDYSKAEAPYDYNPMLSRERCGDVMRLAGSLKAG